MSNRAYLLNTRILTNDYGKLFELSERHGAVFDEVAEGVYRLPLPWLCCFRQSDLKPYVPFDDEDDEDVRETFLVPCAPLATAVRNLKASLPLFEMIVGDERIALEYWQDAVRALELLPLPFLSMYVDEVVDGEYDTLVAALSGGEDAKPHLEFLCDYDPGSQPYTLAEWTNYDPALSRNDKARRSNTVALDCGFGFGTRSEGDEPYRMPRKVFLERGQGTDLGGLAESGSVVATLVLDSFDPRDFGLFCFVLDESNKPLPGGYAVSAGSPASPDGGVVFLGALPGRQDIRLDFSRLSPKAHRLILMLQRGDAGRGELNYMQVRVSDAQEGLAEFTLPGHEVPDVPALIVGEFRLDAGRRFNAACQPYAEGVAHLLKHFGMEASQPARLPDMPGVLRPGVDQFWLRRFPDVERSVVYRLRDGVSTVEELAHYVRHGNYQLHRDRLAKLLGRAPIEHVDQGDPPSAVWEGDLRDGLNDYARHRLGEFEIRCVRERVFDSGLAVRAYAAAHTGQMVALHRRALGPIRLYGGEGEALDAEGTSFTAFGVAIGCLEPAFRLARLQVAAWRSGGFARADAQAGFILRILADFFGETEPVPMAETVEPVLDALFLRWRGSDLPALADACLAACDLQTRSESYGEWTYVPVLVPLVFALRRLLGLANPVLSHPLMDGVFGALPEPVAFDDIERGPDDLIARVRQRMSQDGYDEAAIAGEWARQAELTALVDALDLTAAAAVPSAPQPEPQLRAWTSSNFGMVLSLPLSWERVGDDRIMRLVDRQAGAELDATGFERDEAVSLTQWAKAALAKFELKIPGVARFKPPYVMASGAHKGIAAEYRGQMPGAGGERHVLVLCLQAGTVVQSVTLSAGSDSFARNETLYRWLLQSRLDMGRYPRENQDFDRLSEFAEQGDAACQFTLGERYFTGNGVARDYRRALHWFRLAAGQKHPQSIHRLGCMYYDGEGVAQNYEEALAWFNEGAALDSFPSKYGLGLMYYNGRGVERDFARAFALIEQAGAAGMPEAQFLLGFMCQHGQGRDRDPALARQWYGRAAAQGNSDAQRELGFLCESGQGGPQDHAQALDWYRKAASQDDGSAQFLLSQMYAHGRGVAQDHASAVEWLQKAAAQGHAEAQRHLGERYAAGKGVVRNDVLAFGYFQRAAEQGDAIAQFQLARMYHHGQGVEKNNEQAIRWYRAAAERGHAEARALLGPRPWWKIW